MAVYYTALETTDSTHDPLDLIIDIFLFIRWWAGGVLHCAGDYRFYTRPAISYDIDASAYSMRARPALQTFHARSMREFGNDNPRKDFTHQFLWRCGALKQFHQK